MVAILMDNERKDLDGRNYALIEVQLSRNFLGRSKENHGKLQSG
jgi:hypothetical protein